MRLALPLCLLLLLAACQADQTTSETGTLPDAQATALTVTQAEDGTITIGRQGESEPLITQNAAPDHRPYLHPIMAPDGRGELTEYSPGHHKHQTGLYWGLTRVNDRDYFHHPEGTYWQRTSAEVLQASGEEVRWQTVYNMLGEAGETIMTETQTWTLKEMDGRYVLDLDWNGRAGDKDVTIGEYDYGGLFLRMPWTEDTRGDIETAARSRNERAEGTRAMWLNIGMVVPGRDDFANIAIMDHVDNRGYPQTWRVDGQMGVGPASARQGSWTVPAGGSETFKHRLLVYTDEFSDVAINESWKDFVGQSGQMYSNASLWGIAQEEAMQAEFLTPERAVEEMTVKEGFQVNAYAAEPMITQPMAFAWDDKGRMWIAENRDYESRGDGFSNSGDSRILVLEDTDNDGEADSRKVFIEGIPFPSAIAVGFDGLYLGAPPHLMFIPDRNQDDVADTDDIEILLSGWGIRDRHETINSLTWGPDGWLYGLEGFATPSRIRKPAPNERIYKHKDPFPDVFASEDGVDIDGGVWRYHPTKDRFEVVAHGFSNPWGIDYDANGQLFISACVIPHLFHIIPGGIYQRQGGRHFSEYVYSDIQHIVDHRHRSAHGGARVYQSDAFPEEHHGRLFMANIHEHAVLSDILTPKGSGFVASHGEDFLMANNAQWIGFSMEIGPEGGVYVLDWHDADICGKDVHDKDTGRVFRITPKESLANDWEGRYGDLREMTDLQLADLQVSPSDWHARRARVVLQHRATKTPIDAEALDLLGSIFDSGETTAHRLKAMWALHVSQALSVDRMAAALEDGEEYVRSWAIQLLTEDGTPNPDVLSRFVEMAESDASPVVRKYLASALQRIDLEQRWDLAAALSKRAEDKDDHNIPLLVWFGAEPLFETDPDRALNLAGGTSVPLLTEFIARRAVDADETDRLIASMDGQSATHQTSMLKGMLAGLEGRTDVQTPSGWSALAASLGSDGEIGNLARRIGQQFGDSEAGQRMLATLTNAGASAEDRNGAISGLAGQKHPDLQGHLPGLLDNPETRVQAIRAVAAYEDSELGESLIAKYSSLNTTEKAEVVQTMASRPTYGWQLTEELKKGTIAKRDVPAYMARQLRRVVGNGFVEVWGPIDDISANLDADYRKYRGLLTESAIATADQGKGEALFQQVCGSCHVMFGEGGDFGPELTGSNRTNLEYLLSNVLAPSEVIQDDYKMVVITTQDGRTYAGNIASENDRQVTMRIVGQDPVPISKSDIRSREETPVSMMPEGMFKALSDAEVVDLVGYLMRSGGGAAD